MLLKRHCADGLTYLQEERAHVVALSEIPIRILIPFVALRLAGLALLIVWPSLVLWFPNDVFGN